MLKPMGLACVIMCVSSLFLVSQAQLFETGAASLGSAPVGFISRVGVFGDSESFASLGNAPVGVYQRRQYPQPWYLAPRISVVETYPPARLPIRPPVVRPPVQPPCQLPGPCRQVVKPFRPVQPPCQLPGPCRNPVVKPVWPVLPPPLLPHYKPVVRPPVKPGVRPPMKPGVRPPKRPIRPYRTRKPNTYRPRPKPGGPEGRIFGGMLSGILG